MIIVKNKKGSIIIVAMLFFITLAGAIFVFIDASKKSAIKSSIHNLENLWGNSVMGEYDLQLLKKYNLFGYYGIEKDVSKKMDFYANYSFDGKKYINYQGCSCSLFNYTLANTEIFKEQVTDVGKIITLGKLIEHTEEEDTSNELERSGVIRNEAILYELPSNGSSQSVSISATIGKLKKVNAAKDIIKDGSDALLENQYIFKYFKDASESRGLGKTFFQNEIEYILFGKKSDDENKGAVKRTIVGIRTALNLAYLTKDPKKYGEAMAAAELLTPGPMAPITQKGLLAAWALAEGINDYNVLVNSKKVPLMKDETSWAVDLESIVKNKAQKYIETNNSKGDTYGDYIRTFVYCLDEQVKLLRMMDIIQINMKYTYYGDFLLKNYNGGLECTLRINDEEYMWSKKY